MRRLATICLGSALLLAPATGCGGGEAKTPSACLEGPRPYSRALAGAPDHVALPGGVAIDECLVENQPAGDLARVGAAMVSVATRLNAEARARPGGAANVRLGYLVGAAQRGADRNEGIDAELIRRLAAAASYSPDNRPLPPGFETTYREGFDAGRAGG